MPTPAPNIWQLQLKGDVEGLTTALHHSDSGTRRGAAAALRALGAWQAVPALQAALSQEHDWQAYAAISAALQYLDHDIHIETLVKNRDVRGLSKMLNSSKLEEVLTACDALASIGDRQAVEPLIMVFRNPMLPNKARLVAAEALLKLEGAPAVVTLLGALRRDDWQVRRNAAAVLGQLQAGWATEPLIRALSDANQTVARTAAAALRRIGTPEAITAALAFEERMRKIATQSTVKPKTDQLSAPVAAQPGKVKTDQLPPLSLTAKPKTAPLSPSTNLPSPLPTTPIKSGKTDKLPPLPGLSDSPPPQSHKIEQSNNKPPEMPQLPASDAKPTTGDSGQL